MSKPQTYFQSRVNSGKVHEEFYKLLIEKNIEEQLKNNNTFNLFDFENNNFKIELKTREVTKDKYKTTIVGYDNLEKGLIYIEEGLRTESGNSRCNLESDCRRFLANLFFLSLT